MTLLQTFSGSIHVLAMKYSSVYTGRLKLMTTVVGFVAVALVIGSAYWFIVVFVFIVLNSHATLAALNAQPLVNFTPLRKVNVTVCPPLEKAYLVASHGITEPGLRKLNCSSGS